MIDDVTTVAIMHVNELSSELSADIGVR